MYKIEVRPFFLRNFSQPGDSKKNFHEQDQERCNNERLICLISLGEMLDVHLRFLQFINILIDLLQLLVIGSSIEITIGSLGNILQSLRVYFHRNIHVLNSPATGTGYGATLLVPTPMV